MRIALSATTILILLILTGRPAHPAGETVSIEPLAVHAHRFQDFQRGAVVCEIFGEIKNIGTKPVKSFTLHLEMLDRKGKVAASEDLTLPLRVIVPPRAKGVLRPVQPQEIGNFIQETRNCPDKWQEGRIRYSIKAVQTE